MSNPNMEAKVKELMELKRMREELDAEIAAAEDEIKKVMGDEETLFAGAFKVSWKTFTSSRLDSTALKKALPEIAARFTKQTTARRFSMKNLSVYQTLRKPAKVLPAPSGNAAP